MVKNNEETTLAQATPAEMLRFWGAALICCGGFWTIVIALMCSR
jgi:hypothetical protein